jgi:hypothetical protein
MNMDAITEVHIKGIGIEDPYEVCLSVHAREGDPFAYDLSIHITGPDHRVDDIAENIAAGYEAFYIIHNDSAEKLTLSPMRPERRADHFVIDVGCDEDIELEEIIVLAQGMAQSEEVPQDFATQAFHKLMQLQGYQSMQDYAHYLSDDQPSRFKDNLREPNARAQSVEAIRGAAALAIHGLSAGEDEHSAAYNISLLARESPHGSPEYESMEERMRDLGLPTEYSELIACAHMNEEITAQIRAEEHAIIEKMYAEAGLKKPDAKEHQQNRLEGYLGRE